VGDAQFMQTELGCTRDFPMPTCSRAHRRWWAPPYGGGVMLEDEQDERSSKAFREVRIGVMIGVCAQADESKYIVNS
jgi:hypothetical protein